MGDVLPGLLKWAVVGSCIVGLLFLASGIVDVVPDVVWISAVAIVLVATAWDMVKRLRERSRLPPKP
jgi:hypothetical protein